MGFWPFGGGKRQRVVENDDHGHETLLRRTPSDALAQQEKFAREEAQGTHRTNSKSRRDDSRTRRLSKTRLQSSKAGPTAQPSRSQTAPVRPVGETRHTSQTNSQYDEKGLYQQNPMSQSSLGPENFTVVRAPPTLHAKRAENDSHLARTKSSKRKAEDYAREREIRAMTSSPIPIPKRPATLYGTGPLQRDSRNIPGALNRRLERPTSEISLPLPGSLADVSDFPNQNSFKVGMLAALSPRPTIRYDANSKYASSKQATRSNIAIRQAIVEEDVSDKKRIDELADDLDAGGLRELMERDRRRRERKKEADKAKLQRKLRRAERQREEEARRARTEAFVRSSPTATSRAQGLGIESVPEPKASPPGEKPIDLDESNPFGDPGPSTMVAPGSLPNPFEDERDMDVIQNPREFDAEDAAQVIPVPVRSPLRRVDPEDVRPKEKPSQSTLSPPVSPVNRAADRSSLSQGSLLNREVTPDIPETASIERRMSDQSSQRLSSWATFFKRGGRRKFMGPLQGRATPSEFSNTSRESFSRKQPNVVQPRTFRRSDSATPQRTMSRFREDLPELPISPPDSRVQSPEATVPPAGNVPSSEGGRDTTPSLLNISSTRDSSGMQIAEQMDRSQQKRSVDLDVPLSASTGMILSQSLASVDSEGSWLSGRPPKRTSGHVFKPSQSSLQRSMPGAFDQGDDQDLMEDGYDDQISPAWQDPRPSTLQRAGDMAGSKEHTPEMPTPSEPGDERWHQSIGRQPTVVRQAGRAKSKEGLLKEFAAAEHGDSSSSEAGDDQDSASLEAEAKDTPILRARSVEYKGHIRHISAGSAKLLDIRRSSMHSDHNRSSIAAHRSDLALHLEDSPDSPIEP